MNLISDLTVNLIQWDKVILLNIPPPTIEAVMLYSFYANKWSCLNHLKVGGASAIKTNEKGI